MLKFSLLISTYNGAKYIARLIDSLLVQDIPYSEYEIVCVDDCSSDNTVAIIESYQAKYPLVRLVRNECNKRAATNVNILVDSAQGKYFMLFGHDDFLEPNCLNKLYRRLEEDRLDVLLFNYRRVYEDETTQSECKVFKTSLKQTGIDWIKQQFSDRDYCQYVLGYEWRAVYRTAFWREKGLRCVDGMNYEDTVIMMKAIVNSDAVASIDDILYNYRINCGSITYRKDFVKRGDLIYEFAFMVGQEVEDFYNDLLKIDPQIAANLYRHLLQRYNNFSFDLVRTPNKQKREFYQLVNENRQYVDSKRQYMNWKAKLLTNSMIGYPVAWISYYAYKMYKSIVRK